MKNDKKRTLNLLDVLLVFIVASIVSYFISINLFYFVGGFTAILFVIYLFFVWDEIVIWWSTRK